NSGCPDRQTPHFHTTDSASRRFLANRCVPPGCSSPPPTADSRSGKGQCSCPCLQRRSYPRLSAALSLPPGLHSPPSPPPPLQALHTPAPSFRHPGTLCIFRSPGSADPAARKCRISIHFLCPFFTAPF